MMSEEELEGLARDIEANGLLEPIVKYEGLILDGRNRLAACERVGVEPRYTEWDRNGHSPIGFVLSANLHRRHLNAGQKAMIANDARPLFEEEARERQGTRTDLSPLVDESPEPAETAQRAADLVGVSRAYVFEAAQVSNSDPELAEQVREGKVNLKAAVRSLRAKPVPKPKPVVVETERQRQHAEKAKERVERAVGTCNGLARGLGELRVDLAVAVASPEEIKGWQAAVREAGSALRQLNTRLKGARE